MNVLVNLPYSLYQTRKAKKFTGPLHFSSMLLKSFSKSNNTFTGIVFEKMEKRKNTFFKSRLVKDGKNQWLIFSIWIPTNKIIELKDRKSDPATKIIVEKIKNAIIETNPDIFFLNGFSALTFLLLTAVHEIDLTMVVTHHGIWLKEWMALRKDLVKKSGIKFRREIEKDTVRFAKKNIFLSKLSLREFEKHLIKVPKNNLEFITIPYNPTFLNRSYPKKNQGKNLNILFVGRWDAVKNHEAYLAIAKKAHELNLPWSFYSVCNIFNYPHYADIQSDYEKYINVLPTVPAKELKKIYKMSHVSIVPSHFDVYPGVVTESLLQNRPAIISPNVGWIDEYIKHGIKHWVADFSNHNSVIQKIKKISGENVPKSLYNQIVEENNPKYVFKRYHSLFEQLYKGK
ncbi:MAG: glycosyltransferase family 4 protein [Candidatus Doudnabacteria bacterium]|nr:glycosyltransferase family 4 protein [Candidatus Doudnabacteria bacterium]